MSQANINGAAGAVALVTINDVEYGVAFRNSTMEAVTQQIPSGTYSTEPNENFSPGITEFTFTGDGFLPKGVVNAGDLMPPPSGVPLVHQFDASCTIGGTFNGTRCRIGRPFGQLATLSLEARCSGTVVVAWVST